MPRGDKSSYSSKQKRQAAHIEKGYRRRGVSQDEAEERAWRTVNKYSGGAAKKKSGRKSTAKTRGGRKSATRKKTSGRKSGARKTSARSRKSTRRTRRGK